MLSPELIDHLIDRYHPVGREHQHRQRRALLEAPEGHRASSVAGLEGSEDGEPQGGLL